MTELHFFITQQDIEMYALISGDHNPIHLDEEQAKSHGLPGTIAHGMLTMAKVWSVISNNLLTPTDFPSSYELEFPSPIYAGDAIVLRVEKSLNRLQIEGKRDDQLVVKGFILLVNVKSNFPC